MPSLYSSPRIFDFLIWKSPGSVAPTGANGYRRSALTLGAPHTTWTIPAAAVHRAQAQAVGVGVRPGRDHAGHHDVAELGAGRDHLLDGRAPQGQVVGDLRGPSSRPGTMSLSQR